MAPHLSLPRLQVEPANNLATAEALELSAYLHIRITCSILPLGDWDEAFDLCSLCVCVWQSERAEAGVATIAGTYADTDMAGGGS